MRIKKRLVRKAHVSKRYLPRNFIPEDFYLFKNEIIKKIDESYVNEYNNISIYNNSLFNRFDREILSDDTKMGKVPLQRKIKLHVKKNNLSSIKKIDIDKASWALDEKSNRFFHWYTDTLSRILNISDITNEYPVLIPADLLDNNYIRGTLDNLKINHLPYDQNKVVKINTLIIPSHTAPTGNYNKEIVTSLSRKLRTESAAQNLHTESENIWISRSNGGYRKILNEKEFVKVLKKFNFTIYYPEQHNFEYNQNTFSKAKIIGGLHGAGLTNMMFMQRGGKVIEIRRTGDHLNNCYFSLASDLELEYFYINAKSENNNMFESDCYLDPDKLENLLQKI